MPAREHGRYDVGPRRRHGSRFLAMVRANSMRLEPEYWIKCVRMGAFTWLCHCTQDVEMC